jgi:hypothetical protein
MVKLTFEGKEKIGFILVRIVRLRMAMRLSMRDGEHGSCNSSSKTSSPYTSHSGLSTNFSIWWW